MSADDARNRPPPSALTADDIRARKGAAPIVSLTAYTTPMAR